MKRFDYVALDRAGSIVRGQASCDSPSDVEVLLSERHLQCIEVSELRTPWRDRVVLQGWLSRNRLSHQQLGHLIEQIGTLFSAGIPLADVLNSLASSMRHDVTRRLLLTWSQSLSEGLTFADAMTQTASQVPNAGQVIGAIRSGEAAGQLETTLRRLSANLATESENASKLKNAMVYPTLLLVTSIVAISYLMIEVVPDLVAVFIHREATLPWSTQTVIATSEFLRAHWLKLLTGVMLLAIVLSMLLRYPKARMVWDRHLLSWPLVGRWICYHNIARWSDSLSLLLTSHLPLPQVLETINAVCVNRELRAQLDAMQRHLAEGERFGAALNAAPSLPELVRMTLQSAESANQLGPAAAKLSTLYQNQLNQQLRTFIELVNPILLILISLLIMFIMLSILTPILDMNQLV